MIKYIKFLLNPKKYFLKKAQELADSRLKRVAKEEFLIPINETKDEDVFIVGYPKSGNTWMQTLMSGLQYGINTEFLPEKLSQEIVPDVHARRFYKRFGTMNFFKSHSLPQKEYRKVIYIVRDGRDALISYYHFNKKLGLDYSIDDLLNKEELHFPCFWHNHVQQWLNNPFKAEILYIKYEDLLEDGLSQMKNIQEFLGINRSISELKSILDGASIDKMRNRVKSHGGMGHKDWEGKDGAAFFRKGKIGDYVNGFNKEEIDSFNKKSYNQLKRFDYNL